MSLKIKLAAIVPLILVLATGSAWSQSSPGAETKSDAQPPVASQPKPKPRHKSLFPDDVVGLQKLAIQSYQNGNYMRFIQATIKLRNKRPYEPQYMVGMVIGAALLGRTTMAYNYMHVMQQQGLSHDFNTSDDTKSIRNTEAYSYLNDLLVKAGEPAGEARVAFTLPKASVQPESIAWDESRGKFLVGTIETGAILAVTPAGEVEELLHASNKNGLQAITGIAVDQAHDRLWVTTAGVPGFAGVLPTDLGRGALMEFKLGTLEFLRRYDVPVDGLPHVPASAVVTPAGDVYLMDRAQQMIFRKSAGDKKLGLYMASNDSGGFKDLALSDAGDKLYVADAALGIVVIDLKTKASNMLGVPKTLNLGGISGLMYGEGQLFMLQNGIKPQRLLRLKLDPSGSSVESVTPLAVALKDFDAPAFGTVHGGTVYYFASGNLPGVKREPAPVKVLKTPVELSEPIVPVEQRKFNADRLKQKEESKAKKPSNP